MLTLDIDLNSLIQIGLALTSLVTFSMALLSFTIKKLFHIMMK